MTQPITWDQIDDLVYQLKQVSEAAKKASQTLKRHQVKPINRIKTIEAQRYELERAAAKANNSLYRYNTQLRARQAEHTHANPSDHPSALPTGSSDQPGRNPEVL